MIQSLKDILIVCDLDHTLLTAQEEMLPCNKATIQLFCALGGRFTVASDRSAASIKLALGDLKLSCPAIVASGASLYDMNDGETVPIGQLDAEKSVMQMAELMQRFPEVGVEVFTQDGAVWVVQANRYTHMQLRLENIGYGLLGAENIRADWAKISLTAHPATLAKVQEYLNTTHWNEMHMQYSSAAVLELLPAKVNKGIALRHLCKQEFIPIEHTIAIGDYYSDLPLMQAAGSAVAVGNAPQEVKQAAKKIVSNCMDGGVGEYIYALIKHYT
ncbi:HAD-IIB family hydrolase [uncultured Allofournierella sp.]|uniref:HAD-IIB family hydrolase n=1 Tax=uncultured Allofournierella sp. TaxID=1940258 RepID=UPI003753949D